jgi:hypothetical protein
METLNPRWLSIELDDLSREIESWNSGLRESFNSLIQDFPNRVFTNQNNDASAQNVEAD